MTKHSSQYPIPPIVRLYPSLTGARLTYIQGGYPRGPSFKDGVLQGSLSLVGLLALADLKAVAWRTALTGTSGLLDALVLCPGLHRQHDAVNLNNGEFPACGAMTSGFVFRVENPATVFYLQNISNTGHLTTLAVKGTHSGYSARVGGSSAGRSFSYDAAVAATCTAFIGLLYLQDWWALSFMLLLSLIRLANALIIRSQATVDWHGASEKGEQGDLFILLSYDRWVRLRGDVDDLKAVTSGRWLRQATYLEDTIAGIGTILAYFSVVVVANATPSGQLGVMLTLLVNAACLGWANACTSSLFIKDRVITVETPSVAYGRRRTLAEELIKESGRDDWAVAMGLIPPKNDSSIKSDQTGPAIM